MALAIQPVDLDGELSFETLFEFIESLLQALTTFRRVHSELLPGAQPSGRQRPDLQCLATGNRRPASGR